MSQLNIYLPPSDSLKSRLEQAALNLQTTPNTLARLVVDEFLETYVTVTAEAEDMKRRSFQDIHERLKSRAAALGVARFQAGTGEAEDRVLDATRRMPRKRRGSIARRTAALSRQLQLLDAVCRNLASCSSTATPTPDPWAHLFRALQLPADEDNGCPSTISSYEVENIGPILNDGSDLPGFPGHGGSVWRALRDDSVDPVTIDGEQWWGKKTMWLSDDACKDIALVRGGRIDAPGGVYFYPGGGSLLSLVDWVAQTSADSLRELDDEIDRHVARGVKRWSPPTS